MNGASNFPIKDSWNEQATKTWTHRPWHWTNRNQWAQPQTSSQCFWRTKPPENFFLEHPANPNFFLEHPANPNFSSSKHVGSPSSPSPTRSTNGGDSAFPTSPIPPEKSLKPQLCWQQPHTRLHFGLRKGNERKRGEGTGAWLLPIAGEGLGGGRAAVVGSPRPRVHLRAGRGAWSDPVFRGHHSN